MSIIAAALLALPLPQVVITGQPSKDPNKVICKSQQNTGSRLQRRRVCHTRAEWGEEERQQRRRADSDGSPFRDEGVGTLPRRPGS